MFPQNKWDIVWENKKQLFVNVVPNKYIDCFEMKQKLKLYAVYWDDEFWYKLFCLFYACMLATFVGALPESYLSLERERFLSKQT